VHLLLLLFQKLIFSWLILMDNVGIIITARVNSSRLYQKVLQKINDRFAIDILLDHIVNDFCQVVLAIPDTEEDDILESIAKARGVEVFRGYNDSPLHRIAACAKQYGFEYVARVTSDDILIDLFLLLRQIKWAMRGDRDYVYMRRCPDGIGGEVIKTSVLEDVVMRVGEKPIEFVSYEIKNKNNYNTAEYFPGFEYQFKARLTMDYEEDLTLIRILLSCMVNPGTLDIINFLKKNRWCLEINRLPAVTVYTCNYNTAPYIVDCMESVMRQSFDDFECIVLDDHSTDDSMNIITEYISKLPMQKQRQIRVVRNEANIGLPSSCNKVLSMARGVYIVRVDSDDRLHPDYLSRTTEQARIDNTQGVFTGYTRVDEQLNELGEVIKNEWHPACALLSRWVVNEIKYRDGVQYCEGDIFYKDFRKHYHHSFISEPLWDYRQRPGQKTSHADHPKNMVAI